MKKSEKVFCAVVLSVLTFFFCTIFIRILTGQILVKRLGVSNTFTNIVLFDVPKLNDVDEDKINWAIDYPFPEAKQTTQSDKGSVSRYTQKIKRTISNVEDNINAYTSDYLIGYQKIVECEKLYKSILRWNYAPYSEYNAVVEFSDGYLTTPKPKQDMQECAENTVSFVEFCESKGIGFLYVNAPSKVCKETDTSISGVTDYSNQNADEFLSILESKGVNTFDLRVTLHEEGLDHHSLFFRTDHHWRPETGLWAAGEIFSVLNEKYGFSLDLSCVDPDRFSTEVYPEWFLGSQGKKVTLASASPEAFTLLYPKFDTLLHYEVKSRDVDSEGDFSITYDMDCITKKDYYGKDPYAAYLYGVQALEKIENQLVDNGYHVLIIHDSFGNCVVPFMSLGIQNVDSIDLREFDGSVQTFIEKEQPDFVIVLNYSGTLQGTNRFSFK